MTTNDIDIIRRAVELADLFYVSPANDRLFSHPSWYGGDEFANPTPILLDALAAQLVRQVDALDIPIIIVQSKVGTTLVAPDEILADVRGPDRTMNTLRAIVESKVLE